MHNWLSTWEIDRAVERRRDARWLAAQLEDEATRFVPVWQLKNLFTRGDHSQPVFPLAHEVRDVLPLAESITLLGVRENMTYFALGLPSHQGSPPGKLAELGQFQELRQIAPLLDERNGALLAYARGMTYWHGRHRFCGDCGSPTQSEEGGFTRTCTNSQCGQQHFPRMDPAVIVLVTCGERCLLGRKAVWPAGIYSTIAGYVEPGESLEDAVVREVREETGVEVKDMAYHSSQPWPFPSSLMLGFTAVTSDDRLRIDQEELDDAAWFARDEMSARLEQGALKLPPSFSVAYRLIREWMEGIRQ